MCPPGILRLILAFVVLLHHSSGALALGPSAVYLFFTLSGYWISLLWSAKYESQPGGVTKFLTGRLARLLPVLVSVLVLYRMALLVFPAIFSDQSASELNSFVWWMRQISLITIVGNNHVPIPTWSLAVEMQFYLIFPLFALFRTKRAMLIGILGSISIACGVAVYAQGKNVIEGNIFSLFAYFACGVVYQMSQKAVPTKAAAKFFLAFALILGGIFLNSDWRWLISNYPEGRTPDRQIIQNIFFYGMTFLLVPFALSSLQQKSSKFDRMLGNLAYPLYLFHMLPITTYYHIRPDSSLQRLFLLLLCWLVSILGAAILYFLVDKPLEAVRKRYF